MQSAPEVETTLARLSTYRNVRGVMVLTRTRHTADTSNTSDTAVLQTTGTVFEDDGGKRYASAVESIVGGVTKALKECDESDEPKFMRIRTKKHELIITPDDKYVLVVLQDPGQ
ncbi:dynein light chain roadblock-type [Cryptococcus neoformans]|nr:dynein light chain roadblock-type [Cryptococcus neoformans var. grubii Bt1]OXH37833.1 dynein light chain roadblock-type [Cryptococcus neoformans var. grubii]